MEALIKLFHGSFHLVNLHPATGKSDTL